MSVTEAVQTAAKSTSSSTSGFVLQRKCACGGSAGFSGECEACKSKKLLGKPLQRKLVINEPGDEYEREADRVAEQVMRSSEVPLDGDAAHTSPAPLVQRRLNGSDTAGVYTAPQIVHDVLNSPGQPLDAATRAFFEPRFGHDFSLVRVHSGERAEQSARDVSANAYTVGNNIVFGTGRFDPRKYEGKRLLAHELTHVLQQSRGGQVSAFSPSMPHEREAAFAIGVTRVRIAGRTGVGLARDEVGGPTLPELNDSDPQQSPRYIDTLFQRVSFSWLNGASTFKWDESGKEKRVTIPLKDLEQDDTAITVALFKVHKSKQEALRTVGQYSKMRPGFRFFSFYVGPEGVVMPTIFSKNSTPEFHKLWPSLKRQIADDAAEIRRGLQPLANVINPIPGTQVDEFGNLILSGDPIDWLSLLKLPRLKKLKEAGPVKVRRHSGYNVPYRVTGPHDKLTGTSVYVLKDAEGTVLYVGKGDVLSRLREHIKDPKKTEWFGEIDRVEVRGTGLNNSQALALEEDLIGQLKPNHNIEKNPFKKEFGNTMEVGPNLPKAQKILDFRLEWGH